MFWEGIVSLRGYGGAIIGFWIGTEFFFYEIESWGTNEAAFNNCN